MYFLFAFPAAALLIVLTITLHEQFCTGGYPPMLEQIEAARFNMMCERVLARCAELQAEMDRTEVRELVAR